MIWRHPFRPPCWKPVCAPRAVACWATGPRRCGPPWPGWTACRRAIWAPCWGRGDGAGAAGRTRRTDWIGRSWRRSDVVSDRLIDGYRATFAGFLGPGAVPPGLHWALSPDLAGPDLLGRDGHPRPGIFVPALPLPRRMWAGGEIVTHAPFTPGEVVDRDSTVTDITFETGHDRAPGLCHPAPCADRCRRAPAGGTAGPCLPAGPAPGTPAPVPPQAEAWEVARSWTITPDPVLLFRYSALTFNGHRIHYDHLYATGVEGYAGLVVHGPMQAFWMLNLAAGHSGPHPRALPLSRPQPADLRPACPGRGDGTRGRNCPAGADRGWRRDHARHRDAGVKVLTDSESPPPSP